MIPPSAETTIAAVALFTTVPTDRALAGWCPGECWLEVELDEMREWVCAA